MTSRAGEDFRLLAGHVDLDVSCLDRIYLNGYVPSLQVGGQVVSSRRPGGRNSIIERTGSTHS